MSIFMITAFDQPVAADYKHDYDENDYCYDHDDDNDVDW